MEFSRYTSQRDKRITGRDLYVLMCITRDFSMYARYTESRMQ